MYELNERLLDYELIKSIFDNILLQLINLAIPSVFNSNERVESVPITILGRVEVMTKF